MALPFLSLTFAFWFGWRNRRKAAITLFIVSLILIIALLQYHITASLNLQF
ncbi:DUF5993 family protein [Flavobacterium shii]|uniref:DUF5993 family protein n=1 Tax=Flavobacterium shii TaxID=2987687 RepID=UPI003850373D